MKAAKGTPLGVATEIIVERALALMILKQGGKMQMTLDEMASMNDCVFRNKFNEATETFTISVVRTAV